MTGTKGAGKLKEAGENFAGAADFHFVLPVLVNGALTNGAVDKPAKIAAFKLPGRTLLFSDRRAFFYPPARFAAVGTDVFA